MTTIRVLVALVCAAAGLATALAIGEEAWAVAGLTAVATFGALGLGLLLVHQREAVRVRPDLARWLDERASMTGEPREILADRALAHYRDLLGDRDRVDD